MNKALFKYFATVLIVTLLFSSSVSMVILIRSNDANNKKRYVLYGKACRKSN